MIHQQRFIRWFFGCIAFLGLISRAVAVVSLPLPPVVSSAQPDRTVSISRHQPTAFVPPPSASQTQFSTSVPKSLPRRVHHTTLEQKNIKEAAFVGMSNNLIPLSPQQIGRFRALLNETRRAAAQGSQVPPLPTSSSTLINLAPGSTPPVIRTASGFITSLDFLDSSGAPWPIDSFAIGDPKNYNIQWDKKSNILLVQSMSLYQRANLAVILKGLNTPIMVTLLSGQKAVDYRVDLRVAGFGPQAKVSMQGVPSSAGPELMKVLDGVPPEHAHPLMVEGGGPATAWMSGHHVYIRTAMHIISPSWISMVSGPDQSIRAYQLPNVSVVLALYEGRVVTLRIKGL